MVFLDSSAGTTQSVAQNLILLAVMFLLLYFLFIRPEQKRRKNLQTLQESLQVGQKVYAGAIVGTIKHLKETTCTLVTGSAEIEILKMAISFVELPKEEEQQPIS
ncbi:preprotein translocase subunit YajC [bacterium]|nr:preprotein translocase subunit YajC [bacterium]